MEKYYENKVLSKNGLCIVIVQVANQSNFKIRCSLQVSQSVSCVYISVRCLFMLDCQAISQ